MCWKYTKQIRLKRINFAKNLKLRNGFKMWYSWFAKCGEINLV